MDVLHEIDSFGREESGEQDAVRHVVFLEDERIPVADRERKGLLASVGRVSELVVGDIQSADTDKNPDCGLSPLNRQRPGDGVFKSILSGEPESVFRLGRQCGSEKPMHDRIDFGIARIVLLGQQRNFDGCLIISISGDEVYAHEGCVERIPVVGESGKGECENEKNGK